MIKMTASVCSLSVVPCSCYLIVLLLSYIHDVQADPAPAAALASISSDTGQVDCTAAAGVGPMLRQMGLGQYESVLVGETIATLRTSGIEELRAIGLKTGYRVDPNCPLIA